MLTIPGKKARTKLAGDRGFVYTADPSVFINALFTGKVKKKKKKASASSSIETATNKG